MFTKYCLIILVVFLLLKSTTSQSDCPCTDPASGATWASEEKSSSDCTGTCDLAIRRAIRICGLGPANSFDVCDIDIPCVDNSTCQGNWSPWANTGACSVSCGTGVRPQTRICYKVPERQGESTRRRNRYCFGGGGAEEQQRHDPCKRRRCPDMPSNTLNTTTVHEISKQEGGIISTPVHAYATSLVPTKTTSFDRGQTSGEFPTRPPGRPTGQPPPQTQAPINILILATVLGSITIVCISLIVVVVIVFRIRKDRQAKLSNTIPLTVGPVGSNIRMMTKEPNNYEVVAPVLPMRHGSSSNILENPRENSSVRQQWLHHNNSFQSSALTKSNTTLDASTTSNHEILEDADMEEATYITIDEYRR